MQKFNFDQQAIKAAQRLLIPAFGADGQPIVPIDTYFSSHPQACPLNVFGSMVLAAINAQLQRAALETMEKGLPTAAGIQAVGAEFGAYAVEAILLLAVLRRSLRHIENDESFREHLSASAAEVLNELGMGTPEDVQKARRESLDYMLDRIHKAARG